jgi:signal transduction histidine kinase/FixJ family two-component response regulator
MTQQRMLVVDDEPGIALLCQRLLSGAGYEVRSFTNPRESLEHFRAGPIDLLLVDIRMPEISGFDLVQQVRELQPDMAILAMTGFGTVEMAIQALRRGVDGLILKPFDKSELISAVEQALTDHQQKRDVARLQALRPLFSVTETLFAERRVDTLLDLILDAVARQLKCSNVAFYQHIPAENTLRLMSHRGNVPEGGMMKQNADSARRAMSGGAAIHAIVDAGNAPDLEMELQTLQLTSLMAVPTTLGNLQSVLFAGRSQGEPPFREADMEMFLILARQATVAMENARLYDELRAYVRRVEESQQALVQAEKLAAAGRLTASIAHEINNPLQSVRNCLHLATRTDIPTDMRQHYINLTSQELERLMSTVQRMLDFYRPSVEFKPVQVLDLLEHVLNLLSQQLRERNIRVTTAWPASLPSVQAISNQIEQVFINIVLNAFDAMPQGGDLWISIAQKRKMVEILFQDSGPGVPPDMQETIFEPFVSSKGTTGLGLSVSYDIVASHGGTLDLLPDRQPGACFRVLLPVMKS